jgi:hypothetical protein
LEAGKPVTVPRYYIGGNDFPEVMARRVISGSAQEIVADCVRTR